MIKKIGFALACTFIWASTATAGMITDVENVNTGKLSLLSETEWTHSLIDEGFVLGSALTGTISIDMWDDGDNCGFFSPLGCETSSIWVGRIDFQDGSIFHNPSSDFFSSLGVNSLWDINATGELSVKVIGAGDFYIGKSTLEVTTTDVPEPGTLALLGLGLAGLGAARRRQKA